MNHLDAASSPEATETTRDVTVDGVALRVASWGSPSTRNRTVLLVHGLTANSRYWANLGPLLAAEGWYVIAPDLRGRGLSAKPSHGYGLAIHAADLLAVMDKLELETVHFVGHSLGAIIGLYAAAVHRQRIATLALVDGGGKLPADAIEAIGPALARLGVVYPSLPAYLDAMRASPAHPWDAFWERYYRYDAEERRDGTVTSRVPKGAIDEEVASLWTTRTAQLPEVIRTPTLILRASNGLLPGDRGHILTAQEAERLHGAIPGSRLVEIPETNHYTIVRSGAFTPALLDWLPAEA